MPVLAARIPKWTPFRMAYEFRTLRQGTLNIGNDAQNKQNLLTLSIAAANSGPPGSSWAKWRAGFGNSGNTALGTNASSGAGLLLNVPAVPGFVPPVGTVDDGT